MANEDALSQQLANTHIDPQQPSSGEDPKRQSNAELPSQPSQPQQAHMPTDPVDKTEEDEAECNQQAASDQQQPPDTGGAPIKLFVGGIDPSWGITVEDLRTLFGKYGSIEEVVLKSPSNNGFRGQRGVSSSPRGYAFVSVADPEVAKTIVSMVSTTLSQTCRSDGLCSPSIRLTAARILSYRNMRSMATPSPLPCTRSRTILATGKPHGAPTMARRQASPQSTMVQFTTRRVRALRCSSAGSVMM